MKEQIADLFENLEKKKGQVINTLDSMSEEQRRFKVNSEGWDCLQIALHVVKAEQLSVGLMHRNFRRKDELQKAGLGSKIRMFLLRMGLSLPLRFKAPKMVDVTGHTPDYEQLISDWNKVRLNLKKLLDDCDEKTAGKGLYTHPRAGKLNAKQALHFLNLHLSHHQKQLFRIAEHSKRVV